MRTSAFLTFAGLAFAARALALWPQPTQHSFGNAFVQVPTLVKLDFAADVDQQRVSNDLSKVVEDTRKAIQSQVLLPLEVDRGASWKDKIASSPTMHAVEISVVQLLKQHPNQCHPANKRDQQSFRGLNVEQIANAGDAASQCSMTYWATRPLSTNVTSKDIKIDTSKPVPLDLSSRDAEAYELEVPSDGKPAQIRAYTALGAYRGVKTFQQLVYALNNQGEDERTYHHFIPNTPIKISDRPAFPYRGMLLDTSRNYFPVNSLKRLLDGMALVKLNQFHWHITDAQSWPLAFDKGDDKDGDIDLSLLARAGAYSADMVYTESDVRDIVTYGNQRGINVNLEIDMPAHLKSGVEALGDKKMIACNDEDNWLNVAAEPPSGQLNLRPSADARGVPGQIESFVRSVLKRAATLSRSPYLSSGGDEPNMKCWLDAKETDLDESIMKPFMGVVTETTSKAGKLGWVWEEMAIKFPATGATLGKGSIVEAWTTPDNVGKILAANPDVGIVLAPSTHFYLDCGFGGWLGNSPTGQSWCPLVPWQTTYSYDPFNGTKTDQDRARILGGESALWSEQIDDANLEQRAWPRGASAAEVFWTGAEYSVVAADGGKVDTLKRNGTEALERFLDLRERMKSLEIQAEAVQPLWCVLRRGRCNAPAGSYAA